MSNCSNHKKEVAGISDMKQLAEQIGDLHYETLADLFYELKRKLKSDSYKDRGGGRYKIADNLIIASDHLEQAYMNIDSVWKICKPFMQEKSQP